MRLAEAGIQPSVGAPTDPTSGDELCDNDGMVHQQRMTSAREPRDGDS